VVAGVTKSVGYAYTSGDLTTLTTPSGQAVTYGYNSNHQITSVTVNGTTVLSGVTYEPLGPVNGWTWGNATPVTRTYDGDCNITQIASNGQKTLTYDNASRVQGITDTASGSSSWTYYGYDDLDRLTSGANGTLTRGWAYDANGNRLTETGSSPSSYSISPMPAASKPSRTALPRRQWSTTRSVNGSKPAAVPPVPFCTGTMNRAICSGNTTAPAP
jgi:YD repeat-containing protein